MLQDAPAERGNALSMQCCVDVDWNQKLVDRGSQMWNLILPNCAPVWWHSSNRDLTVATGNFGSEDVAIMNAVESVEVLQFKLRMFGFQVMDQQTCYVTVRQLLRTDQSLSQLWNEQHDLIDKFMY